MGPMIYISNLIIPLMLFYVLIFGAKKKVDLYGSFAEGALSGLKTVFGILPSLIGLMMAVSILRASGITEIFSRINTGSFPSALIPLGVLKLFSSSAATSLMLDIFRTAGPDSFSGRIASVMMSCTETVFYTMSVYFLSVKAAKTRYTLPCALIANISGITVSYFIVLKVFGM